MKLFNLNFLTGLCIICGILLLGVPTNTLKAQTRAEKEGNIRKKVFIFHYADYVTQAQVDSVKADFLSLPALVDGMVSAEWGKDRKNNQKHCLILTFTGDDAHERYANHPVHKALGTKFAHLMKDFKMEIVDFWAQP